MSKKYKSILVIWLLLLFYYHSFSQEDQQLFSPSNLDRISDVLKPSPSAASLGSFGGVPVGLVNGSPNVKVDLFTLSTNKLSVPIGIHYSTTGFKVNQVASRVGFGWMINLGGMITRTVNNYPDELAVHETIPSDLGTNWSQSNYDFLTGASQNQNNSMDLQPDIFNFSFGGYSGKFILDTNLNPVPIPHSDLKIESNFLSSGTGNIEQRYSFKITTPDGIIYYFGGDAVESSGTSSYGLNSNTYKDYDINPTAYSLRKIVHPNGEYVEFFYSSYQYYYLTDIQQSASRRLRNTEFIGCGNDDGPHELPSGTIDAVSVIKAYNDVQRLDSVKLSNGLRLDLSYVTREDLIGEYLIDKINYSDPIRNNSKAFQFTYNTVSSTAFLNSWNQNDASLRVRPFLSSVSETPSAGNEQGRKYLFQYNDQSSLPTRLSYCQDYWGYFNGASNTTLLYLTDPSINNTATLEGLFSANADRSPHGAYSSKALLSKIIYPTGGSDSILYEANTYKGTQQVIGNIQNHPVSVQALGNSDATPLSTQQSFTLSQDQTVPIQALSNFTGNSADFEPEYYAIVYSVHDDTEGDYAFNNDPSSPNYLQRLQNIKIFAGNNSVQQRSDIVTLKASHTYTISLTIYGLSVFGSITLTYQTYDVQTVPANIETGGVRVQKVITTEPVTGIVKTTKYFYAYPYNLSYSSFDGSDAPTNFDNVRKGKIVQLCATDISCDINSAYSIDISSRPKYHISLYNGDNVAYPCVIESYGETFENGGIEHRFNTVRNLPPIRVLGVQPVLGPTFNTDWAHGVETYTRTFKLDQNGGFQTINERSNVYSVDTAINQDYPGLIVRKNYADRGYGCTELTDAGFGTSLFDAESYSVQQRWFHLDSTYDATYDQSFPASKVGNYTTNTYGSTLHLAPTQTNTSNSKGEIKYVRRKYVTDYSNYAANPSLNNLFSLHGVDLPIEEVLVLRKSNNAEYVISGRLNIYKSTSGKILLDSVLQLDLPHPLLYSSFMQSYVGTSGQLIHDPNYKSGVVFDSYDGTGNIIQQHKLNDIVHSYLWDYSSFLPIAEATNALSSDIAYTSFEADGTGNWSIGSVARDTVEGITGAHCYNANSDIFKSSLISSKTYIVSYWTKRGSPFTVAGTILGYPMKGKTINGWTLYIHKVTGQSTIPISGNGLIDELRLYPAEAQMATYTFQPLIGMTSSCDVGNRITYYEYDGLQRLKRIRDQDYNIIKSIDYQYQGSSGCGANCYILTMQTLAGTNTLGYPVGVFNVHGKLLGNAAGASQYVALWNNDTADSRIGTLAAGGDSLHFNLALNSGQSLPSAVTGCRYYQVDLAWNNYDGLRNSNATYVDFGDGTGMRLPTSPEGIASLAANTTYSQIYSGEENSFATTYYVHTYTDTTLKTITFYHNDDALNYHLDNLISPATSLTKLRHLRGNLPQNVAIFGSSCFQDSSVSTVDSIYNWSSIHSITYFHMLNGDKVNPNRQLAYAQDFMRYNTGLQAISTTLGFYRTGYRDTTFKLSRLKSDWNTYFTQLKTLSINDEHWDREDLSALTQLNSFSLVATTQNHQDDTNSPLVPIPSPVLDTIVNQMARGAGQTVSNGVISLAAGGSTLTSESYTAVQFLLSKGWTIYVNGTAITNP